MVDARTDRAPGRRVATNDPTASKSREVVQLTKLKGGRPPKNEPADQVMVDRLVRVGPDPAATRLERRLAAEELFRLHGDWTYIEIAARVGFSERTVNRMARSLGWPTRRILHDVDEMHDKLADALDRVPDASLNLLADMVGVSRETAVKYIESAVRDGVLPPEIKTRRVRRHRNLQLARSKRLTGVEETVWDDYMGSDPLGDPTDYGYDD